jgi:2-keto-4-pentenoate hydratase
MVRDRLAAYLPASRGRRMKAGEIVLTGTALRARFPDAGDEISYRIEGRGETTVGATN